MLQRLLDLKPEVLCDSAHGALTGILQQLFVTGHAAVDLVGKADSDETGDARAVFERVRAVLVQSHFVDADAPVNESKIGVQRIRIPNPHQGSLHIPVRLQIDQHTDPAAALLHAFLVLRVRYQNTIGPHPIVRLEALAGDDFGLDMLYLAGDSFTERYPVTAEIVANANKVVLTLTGQPALVSGGLPWARDDYVRCRDASLLIRPLREALEGPTRPLVIPREVSSSLGEVRVRVPRQAKEHTKKLRWLSTLQELMHPADGDLAETADGFGAHFCITPDEGGYIFSGGETGTDEILPVRCLAPAAAREIILPEGADGSIAIAFEAIGGAREIGANSYYYAFGHRGLLIDAGYDATRDGWLGLPALERLARVDAIVLTHSHLDHIGAVPALLAAFPNAPVYCTRATLAVLFPQLTDSAKVSEIRFRQTGEAPAISHGLVAGIRIEQFRVLDYRVRTELPEIPGLTLEFYDAGHIIGSACSKFEFCGVSIIHTGDISVEDQHLLRGMQVSELAADHVVMEGTYCGEPDFGREHRRAAVVDFFAALAERIDAGGSVLVPAFSLGRAQELVGMLVDWNDDTNRSVPIWTAGLVNKLNEISAAHPTFLPLLSGNPFKRVRPFPVLMARDATEEDRRVEYARVFFELAQKAPCVVIASHGMMTEGTGSYLIARAILASADPRHAIFLCGYMDPRTPGFRLRFQRDQPIIDFGPGDPITRSIPPERIQFHRLTAHASYEELVDVVWSIPKRSVTFIHGDGAGLNDLIDDLRQRLNAAGRPLTLRAPAIGERVLIERVRPPSNWDVELFEAADAARPLGPGRKFDKATGFSVRGLTADRRWALIPVGSNSLSLVFESDRIDPDRVDRVELGTDRGQASVVFDREKGVGDLSRIVLTEPGKWALTISARDPSGQQIRASLMIFCGAEFRATRTTVDAIRPVLEFEVGGCLDPKVIEVTSGQSGRRLDIEEVSWESISRVLRVRLGGVEALGSIDDVQLRIRWPNGFNQSGPSVGNFILEPCVNFDAPRSKVGAPSTVRVQSTPSPVRARVDGQILVVESQAFEFVPSKPGIAITEFEYPTLDGGREWREVGSIEVAAAASLGVPTVADTSKALEVTVCDIDASFHGAELELTLNGKTRDRWTASAAHHVWSGAVDDADPLHVAVLAQVDGLTLCQDSVRVYGAFQFDANNSLPVTTSDGVSEAELSFVGPTGWKREGVEHALSTAGFIIRGWKDGTLRVVGSVHTLGTRNVCIVDGARTIEVRIVTLSNLHLSLVPPGPFDAGAACSVHTSAGEIADGLATIDGGPLVLTVERVSPFFDELSARIIGNRVHFLHPGRYVVSLAATGQRLSQVEANVEAARQQPFREAVTPVQQTATSTYDLSVAAGNLQPYASTAILSHPREFHRVVQDRPAVIQDTVWRFLSACVARKDNVLVSWPGLKLGDLGGRLLRRLRAELPSVCVAHMSYPAPRGEIAIDQAHAQALRRHRVLCSVPAWTTIDRLDAYRCTKCEGSPRLKADNSRLWQECPACGHEDRELVLTLAGMRSTDVQVLFADYRIAKYLSRGLGRRYAGAFGRAVRCSNCSSLQPAYASPVPWDRTELRGLLTALSATWDDADRTSSIRRGARLAAGRKGRSRPGDVARLEDALRRLVDVGVLDHGRAPDPARIDKLEAALSLCCGRPVVWSNRRIVNVYLDVEELLNPAFATSMHPELVFGQAGIRQLLTLSD